jgi:hypothetical protein
MQEQTGSMPPHGSLSFVILVELFNRAVYATPEFYVNGVLVTDEVNPKIQS